MGWFNYFLFFFLFYFNFLHFCARSPYFSTSLWHSIVYCHTQYNNNYDDLASEYGVSSINNKDKKRNNTNLDFFSA